MVRSKLDLKKLLFFFTACLLVGCSFFYSRSLLEQRFRYATPKQIQNFTFGYRHVFADALWLQAIQNFDFCEEQIADKVCKKETWLYQTLDLISDLSPQFRMPMATGPLVLSVIIGDQVGASQLFLKAVAQYPKDWRILYRAGYHFLYEENDKAKAADFLQEAGRYGAPKWVFSLATRLYTEAGQAELAEKLVSEFENSDLSPDIIANMKAKIQKRAR